MLFPLFFSAGDKTRLSCLSAVVNGILLSPPGHRSLDDTYSCAATPHRLRRRRPAWGGGMV